MSSTDSPLLSVARALGTGGAGLATGLTLGVSLWTFPAIYSVDTIAPRDRLHLWSKSYDAGAKTMIALIPLTSFTLLLSSFLAAPPAPYLPSNVVGRNRRLVLALAGVSSLGIGIWTRIMMWSKIQALKKAEEDIIADPLKNNGRVEVDTIILEWLALHRVRIVLAATAFAMALTELVAA